MSIYELFNEIKDVKHEGTLCDFNGYLEDYLGLINEENPNFELLNGIFELDNDFRIIENLKIQINKESISNQIIKYRDVYKISDNAIIIKYVLYSKNINEGKAFIFDDEFIFAKGLYYILTEDPKYYEYRNDLLTFSLKDDYLSVKNSIRSLQNNKIGKVQKDIDQRFIKNYEEGLALAIQISEDLSTNIFENIKNDRKNKARYIEENIVKWFLLKKFLYVQYMINKNILNQVHEGNVKKQRNQAKLNAEKIRFVPLSSLWREESTTKTITEEQ